MARITKYGAQQFLLSVLAPDVSNNPSVLWFALLTAVPPLETDGNSLAEVSDANYARASYSVGSDFWTLEGFTAIVNSQEIVWETPSADWGRIVGWALCTDSAGGTVLASGELSTPRFIPQNANVSFPAGSVRIRMEF